MECSKERIYTVEETAEILSIAKETVYDLIRAGTLKASAITPRAIRVSGQAIWDLYDNSKKE